ncbi:MAG: heat-inducible transcriptional repressor HrcA [Deltaproteobacteria bacterium]|nr:heat-inducible transcriptional repressor HrcA [Deltaproteobacteria bacterium]
MNETAATRIKNILQTVIIQYIYAGEPVGSGMVSKRHIPHLSPATIRHIMSEMEEMGYLMQPHASAGRIPTDKGFRFYIDSILKIKELPQAEREKINARCQRSQEIENIMSDASSILSSLSNCMGVVLAPRFDNVFIKHIEFIRLGRTQVMMLLVSNSAIVQNYIVRIEEDLKQHDLERMSAYLNSIAKGLTLRKLKKKIIEEMRKEKTLYDRLMAKALKLSKAALDEGKNRNAGNIYVEGKANIFDQPEFIEDAEKMKLLFKTFEEKSVLVKVLDKAMDANGVQIFIGPESGFDEIRECSVVTAPYSNNGNIFGTLGIIGPMRMNYSRVIPLVNYTADLLSDIMARREAV